MAKSQKNMKITKILSLLIILPWFCLCSRAMDNQETIKQDKYVEFIEIQNTEFTINESLLGEFATKEIESFKDIKQIEKKNILILFSGSRKALESGIEKGLELVYFLSGNEDLKIQIKEELNPIFFNGNYIEVEQLYSGKKAEKDALLTIIKNSFSQKNQSEEKINTIQENSYEGKSTIFPRIENFASGYKQNSYLYHTEPKAIFYLRRKYEAETNINSSAGNSNSQASKNSTILNFFSKAQNKVQNTTTSSTSHKILYSKIPICLGCQTIIQDFVEDLKKYKVYYFST